MCDFVSLEFCALCSATCDGRQWEVKGGGVGMEEEKNGRGQRESGCLTWVPG